MTEATSQNSSMGGRAATIVLGIAAISLAASIIYAATRGDGAAVVKPPVAPVTAPGAAPESDIDALRKKVSAAPQDTAGWQALGDALFRMQRFDEAAQAFDHAATLDPRTALHWSSLGEARVMASKADPMPPTALDAFRRAHELDNKDPRSRYFLAVARDLKGEHQGAIDDWLALLKDTPPGAPWEQDLRRTIEQVGKINNIDVTAKLAAVSALSAHAPMAGGALGAIPGPNSEQIQQAAALTPTQQNDMAHSMVESLEAKLKTNPGNIDGWLMLVRSRVTLQEPAKARAALQAAIAANPGARERLQGEAAALGVTP